MSIGPYITSLDVEDIRFPTSSGFHGSDAMNPAPDYSCAYVTLNTNDPDIRGVGLTFTLGRGNDLCVAAVKAIEPMITGSSVDALENDMAAIWHRVVGDSQLRWLGPEKGVIHLAAAAILNAVWDMLAKRAGLPVWKYVSMLSSEQIINSIDFRHISDFVTPEEGLEILKELEGTSELRIDDLEALGFPGYSTSAGWLGYDDETFAELIREALDEGWTSLKLKVGNSVSDDRRRLSIFREIAGDDIQLMIDANQVWDVDRAIAYIHELADFDIYWVEVPTSPDDIYGHERIARAVAPIRIATGEHCHNRVMFKQFFQRNAIEVAQVDGCRLGGLNEVLAIELMAAKVDVAICPHAGGVGLCEYAQHLSMIDYVRFSGKKDARMTEHAGQLHEHFVHPISTNNGHYLAPERPGFSVDMKPTSIQRHLFPNGSAWNDSEPDSPHQDAVTS